MMQAILCKMGKQPKSKDYQVTDLHFHQLILHLQIKW
jgi:hypothetical protein